MSGLKRCSACKRLDFPSEFHRDKTRPDGLYPKCKNCRRTGDIARNERLCGPKWKERESVYGRAYRLRERLRVIAEYGGECQCCGEKTREFLTIDHTKQDGAHQRRHVHNRGSIDQYLKRSNYPKDDFRLLCMNCNFSYGKHGYCPHEAGRSLYAVG